MKADLYPFGLKHKGYNNGIVGSKNNYKTYQGQEFTEDLGLNIHEWKYRVSDPAIGRFWQVDPLTQTYHWMTPYQFASNQPIHANEIEGLENEDDKSLMNRTTNPVVVEMGARDLVPYATMEVVRGTTGEIAKEGAKKGGSKALGTLLKGTGVLFAMLTDYMSPDFGGETSENVIFGLNGYNKKTGRYEYKIDENLKIDNYEVKDAAGDKDSPIRRICDNACSFKVEDSESNTAIISHQYNGETIEIGGDFNFDGDVLTIDNFDVEGSTSNNIGIKGIRSIMKILGTELDVKTIITNGVPRTTGANPGKVTKLTFEIEKL